MRNFAFGLAALALASSANAQTAAAPQVAPITAEQQRAIDRLQAAALQSDLAYEIVDDLVTRVGPRLAGSPAEARGREWAANMLRANRFSNVRIETPFETAFWDATREQAYVVTPTGRREMVIAALGGSPSTPAGGLEGDVVRFESLAALNAASNASVAGRIVFIDEPMARTQDASGYGAAVAKRGACAPMAQAKGAIACVIRSVGTNSNRFPHQGGPATQRDGTSLPNAALSPPDADALTGLLRHGPVRMGLIIETEFNAHAQSANVIAEVRGRERPNEIVLIAAHLDSWDMGQGAIDDGAGVAIITAAARLIRDMPRRPRRTIRILLAGNEEHGGFGGIAYWNAHSTETHIISSESDLGADRVWRMRSRVGEGALPYARAIQRALAPLAINLGGNDAEGGTDIGPATAAGVPVIDLDQDATRYFDVHHTPDDTMHMIDPAQLRQNVAAWATFLYLAADTDWDFRKAE